MNVEGVKTIADRIRAEVRKAIIGQTDTLNLMLVALFSGGHVLLEARRARPRRCLRRLSRVP